MKHEIDIYVTALIATGYESTFIFECKNWEAKVNKNELIVFSEKIAITGAQTGFFVAKKFTRDAKAQASKDSRIKLLTTEHFEPVGRVIFPQFHLMNITKTDAKVDIQGFRDKGKHKEIPLEGKNFRIKGEEFAADEYIKKIIENARDNKLNRTPTQTLGEGAHIIEFTETVEFNEGEAFLEKKAIRALEIQGQAEIEIALGSVLSVYEVKSRGRMLVVGASSQGIELKAQVVEIESS